MQLIEGKQQALVLSYRELAVLIAFSATDEKVPTLNGASILLEGTELIAYASDGRKSVRGENLVSRGFERSAWLIPRRELVFAHRAMLPEQDARFVLSKANVFTVLEFWDVEVDGTNHKAREVNLLDPIPCNKQMGLPCVAIDKDLDDIEVVGDVVPMTLAAASLGALRCLALAGLTPNLTIELTASGRLHASTDGGTIWHAIVAPSIPNAEDGAEDDEDESLDEEGKLELKPTETRVRAKSSAPAKPSKRGRPKGSRNKRNGKARIELV